MGKKFIIFTPTYDENVGGPIVLHRLCHLLNEMGETALLFPFFSNYLCLRDDTDEHLFQMSDLELKLLKEGFSVNEHFNTPMVKSVKGVGNWEDYIVIYPEVVFGNPLGAKNVVRWLLHNPGFHTGQIKYGQGELYFRFSERFENFSVPGSTLSEKIMSVIYTPFEIYNQEGVAPERKGVAYCIRKGRHRKVVHDLSKAICIDGKPASEVAAILKSVKRFISYDMHTAYSHFAVLCGCESVVVPEPNISIDEWMPDEEYRAGIAYGESELPKANQTAHLQYGKMKAIQDASDQSVVDCLAEINKFFGF